eukprot:TRINITY_DN11263_c0_g2_i1.p1 TRINITY_DN11263_c0_g2~~TRINITY_DN11263_c0_g2_i1.p1  ORF type:complete len:297 (+),score=68.98 TRINITY_DN11263_c0_g2_i1:1-891(+)
MQTDPGPRLASSRRSEPYAPPKNPFRGLVPSIDYDAYQSPAAPGRAPELTAATHGLGALHLTQSASEPVADAFGADWSAVATHSAAATPLSTPHKSQPEPPGRPLTPMFAGVASSSKAAQALANIESSFLGTPLSTPTSQARPPATAPSASRAGTPMGGSAPMGASTPMASRTPMGPATPTRPAPNYSALGFGSEPVAPQQAGALVTYGTGFGGFGAFGAAPNVPQQGFGSPAVAAAAFSPMAPTPGHQRSASAMPVLQHAANHPPLGTTAASSAGAHQSAPTTPTTANFDPFKFF